ncbi:putative ankyrin repeat protein RF_0381 [Lineus longissimus]|uniref:putative ankyrin repeat protein RF_0381 n=1 Tax=Lineus longissimus TaxID=88925 RepID=UPI002B4C3135
MRRSQAAFEDARIFLSPLHYAVSNGDLARVNDLLETGSDVNYIGIGRTALHYASETGNLDIVEALLGAGANIRSLTIESHGPGRNALQIAYRHGHTEVVRKLIQLGASVERISLLHLSLLLYDVTTVDEILREWKRDVNLRDCYNQTSLHVVAKQGFITLARKLLQTNVCHHTVNAYDCDGMTAFSYVINARERLLRKRTAAAEAASDSDAPRELPSYEELMGRGANDVRMCKEDGYITFLKLLLDNGADVGLELDDQGFGLLHKAGESGDIELVKLLLEYDTTTLESAANMLEKTALYCACESGHEDIVRALLEKGANPNPKFDKYGRLHIYPLDVAVRRNQYSMVEMLLSSGAKTDVFDPDDGNAPIHVAVINQSNDIVELLLTRGASLDIRSKFDKETILHLAWKHNNMALFDNLLDNHQGIMDKTNKQGQTTFLYVLTDFIQGRFHQSTITERYLTPLRELINHGCLLLSPKQHRCRLNVMNVISDVYNQENHDNLGHDVTRFLLGAASGRFESLDEKFLIDLCFFRNVDLLKFCLSCGYNLHKTNARDSELVAVVDRKPRTLKEQCRLEVRRVLFSVQDIEMEKEEEHARRSFKRFVNAFHPRKKRIGHARSLQFRRVQELPVLTDDVKNYVAFQ